VLEPSPNVGKIEKPLEPEPKVEKPREIAKAEEVTKEEVVKKEPEIKEKGQNAPIRPELSSAKEPENDVAKVLNDLKITQEEKPSEIKKEQNAPAESGKSEVEPKIPQKVEEKLPEIVKPPSRFNEINSEIDNLCQLLTIKLPSFNDHFKNIEKAKEYKPIIDYVNGKKEPYEHSRQSYPKPKPAYKVPSPEKHAFVEDVQGKKEIEFEKKDDELLRGTYEDALLRKEFWSKPDSSSYLSKKKMEPEILENEAIDTRPISHPHTKGAHPMPIPGTTYSYQKKY
jgi:hypothetical protein